MEKVQVFLIAALWPYGNELSSIYSIDAIVEYVCEERQERQYKNGMVGRNCFLPFSYSAVHTAKHVDWSNFFVNATECLQRIYFFLLNKDISNGLTIVVIRIREGFKVLRMFMRNVLCKYVVKWRV